MYLGRAGIILPDRVYHAVQSDVDDLVAFARAVAAKYLTSPPTPDRRK